MLYTHLTRSLGAALLLSTSFSAFSAYAEGPEDEIIVTGSPLVRSVDEAITGVSVLTGDELADRLSATIGETLKSEPGVSSTFFGAGASRPIIRGQGGDRVRVLTNGIGSIDASSASPDHAVAVEPAQADRIEVLRGASLLRFGSSGSGGIVNVMDGRIPSIVPDDIEASVRIGASSADLGREVAGAIDVPLGANLVLHLDGTWHKADDYRIPGEAESEIFHEAEHEHEDDHEDEDHDDDDHEDEDEIPDTGRLENSAVFAKSITGGVSCVGTRGFLGASLHHFQTDYGVPGGHAHGEEEEHHDDEDEDHDEDHHDDEHDEDEHEHGEEEEEAVTIGLEQTRVDINGALEMDGFIEKVQLFAGIADYTHTEFEGPGVVGTIFTNEGYEARLEAIQKERNGWAAAYGLQIRERDFSAVGEEAFVPPTKTRQLGAYMFHEKSVGDIHLEAAARFEAVSQENSITGDDRNFDLLSVSGGGDVHVSDTVRLGGTVFRTERAPTTEELFSNGPHLATSQFELGDAALGKETATGIEAAFRHRADQHFLTANVFYTDYSDYVFEVETGEEEDGLDVYQFTAADAKFYGAEIQGGVDVGKFSGFDVSVDALAEYVRAKTDTGNLPRIPPLSILTGIEAQSDRFVLRAEYDYAAKQTKLASEELETEDYGLVNLFATWKAPVDAQNVRLRFSVMNLLDSEARQHTSFLKDLVPLPGRNVRFSISADF